MMNFNEFTSSKWSKEPHYLVIGHPVAHSLSPVMHQAALDHHRLKGRYLAVDLHQESLNDFINWMKREHFQGANITIPYKRKFVQLVDTLDESVRRSGALNTLVRENGSWTGYNTDIHGFGAPLERFRKRLFNASVILFGSGGAARAAADALQGFGCSRLMMVSRNPGRLDMDRVTVCGYGEWQDFAGEAEMFVNCTPLGMDPEKNRSPVREQDAYLLKDKICYDLVYNPLQTKFIVLAERAGAETITGLEMLIEQGNRAFELWTGKTFPVRKVRKILIENLSSI